MQQRRQTGTLGQGSFSGAAGCAQGNFSHLGPAGLLIDDHRQLWASDGNSSLHVFDLASGSRLIATVQTGGTARTDEMAYDPRDGLLLVNNPDETVPFSTVIDAATHTVLGKILFPLASGLEQPVWNPASGLFEVAVPQKLDPSDGAVIAISPLLLNIVWSLPVEDCTPTGLALGANDQAAVGCDSGNAAILDLQTSSVVARVRGVTAVDQVAYDQAAHSYLFASSAGVLAISDERGHVKQELPTALFSHSVLLAQSGGATQVLVPQRGVGVVVYN